MRKKVNNKGFSLVEILIAITILSIVVTPIAYLFFASAQFVNDSEEVGGRTQIANNVAEQFEAMDFDAWQQGGDVRLQTQNSGTVTGSFVSPASSGVGYESAARQTSAPYYISFNNLSASFSQYNAVVTLSTDNYADINNVELFEDVSMDYMAVQNREPTQDPDLLAWQAFILDCASKGYDVTNEAAFKERVINSTGSSRHITVDVSDNAGKTEVSAQYSYTFVYPAQDTGETVTAGVVGTSFPWSAPEIYLTPEDGIAVPAGESLALYMLLYPWYSQSGMDRITVSNIANLPIDLTVVKQIDEEIAIDINDFANKELNYSARLNVIDGNFLTPENRQTVIRSNLAQNLADLNSDVLIDDVIHSYGTSGNFAPESFSTTTQSERIYDIKIELFDINADGTSDYASGPVYTLNTTSVK